jgi:hypothetical protein
MYVDKSENVICYVVTGWMNIMERASGMQLNVISYINIALKMVTAGSSVMLVSTALQVSTSQKTVSFFNEFCTKNGVYLWREI